MQPHQTSSSFFVSRVHPTITNNAMSLPGHPNVLEWPAPTSQLSKPFPTASCPPSSLLQAFQAQMEAGRGTVVSVAPL